MTFDPESDNPRTVEEYRLWRAHRDAHDSSSISPNWRRVFGLGRRSYENVYEDITISGLDNRATLVSCDLYPCSDIAGLTDRPKDRQGPGLTHMQETS